jgi:sensor histidine kinase YesM
MARLLQEQLIQKSSKGNTLKMIRLIKFFFYVVIVLGILFIAFAYIGPILGFDFTTQNTIVEIPFQLETD